MDLEEARKLPPAERVAVALEALQAAPGAGLERFRLVDLARELLRDKPPLDAAQFQRLAELLEGGGLNNHTFPLNVAVHCLAASRERLTPESAEPLRRAQQVLAGKRDRNDRKAGQVLEEMLGLGELPVEAGEAWSDAVRAWAADRPEARALLELARDSGTAKPSRKWLSRAEQLLTPALREELATRAPAWFGQVGPGRVGAANSDVLRGLVHLCQLLPAGRLARPLGQLAEDCLRRPAEGGSVCHKAARACVQVLGAMEGPETVEVLGRLQRKIRSDLLRGELQEALASARARAGPAGEAVSDLGLSHVGLHLQPVGAFTARLELPDEGPRLLWEGRATVPAAVRRDHADELAALKALARECKASLADQRARLEALFLAPEPLDAAAWRRDILDHKLVGTLARRLIWTLDGRVEACWQDDGLVDLEYRPVPADGWTAVSLWHPVEADTQPGWQAWILENRVQQPFPQAGREVFREGWAGVAGTRVGQHAFQALRATMGWEHEFLGDWDHGFPPARLRLPAWGLEAELEVTGGDGLSEAGVLLNLELGPLRLVATHEVPARVFSEVALQVQRLARCTPR